MKKNIRTGYILALRSNLLPQKSKIETIWFPSSILAHNKTETHFRRVAVRPCSAQERWKEMKRSQLTTGCFPSTINFVEEKAGTYLQTPLRLPEFFPIGQWNRFK